MEKEQLLVIPLDMGYIVAKTILLAPVKVPIVNPTDCLVFAAVKILPPLVLVVKCLSPVNKMSAALLLVQPTLRPSV